MTGELPHFRQRPYDVAHHYAARVLTAPGRDKTSLRQLIRYEDGHFRAIFSLDYFTLAEGQVAPTRSQWGSLKKKFKRHDRQVFVFKEHGLLTFQGAPCGYVDFGFLASGAPDST